MDYELVLWCIVGGLCVIFFVLACIVGPSNDTVSKETLNRLNGKRSRDNYIR